MWLAILRKSRKKVYEKWSKINKTWNNFSWTSNTDSCWSKKRGNWGKATCAKSRWGKRGSSWMKNSKLWTGKRTPTGSWVKSRTESKPLSTRKCRTRWITTSKSTTSSQWWASGTTPITPFPSTKLTANWDCLPSRSRVYFRTERTHSRMRKEAKVSDQLEQRKWKSQIVI